MKGKGKSRAKRNYRRKPVRKLKRNPNFIGGPNTAKVIQTTTPTTPAGAAIIANTGYYFVRAGITGARALAMGQLFGLYRIAKLIFKFKPAFDTYISNPGFVGGNGPVSVPTLYYKINRYGDVPAAITEEYLKTMGAKPIRFDDKQVTIGFKPNILLGTAANAGSDSGQVKMTPWLSTDSAVNDQAWTPSTTTHYGLVLFISAAMNGNGQQPVGYFDVTAVYEFKQPRYDASSSLSQVVTETFSLTV